MDAAVRNRVRQRGAGRCEYCRLRQEHAPFWSFQIEHIIPRKHGGSDDEQNLCVACIRCNLGKGSNLTGINDETDKIVPLFNPREQDWDEHFAFQGAAIVGLTPTGRVTIDVLNMNEPQRLQLRRKLLETGELD